MLFESAQERKAAYRKREAEYRFYDQMYLRREQMLKRMQATQEKQLQQGERTIKLMEKQAPRMDDKAKLEKATGKDHHYSAEKELSGRYMGKVKLEGKDWARIDQGKRVALVPWNEQMSQHLGKQVDIKREGNQVEMQRQAKAMERGRGR